ncbi:VOC family protein [Ornithinibacillus bavariensis]|uniref:VOC family protein n=1 Tax=Ornithinibacillus bavariensis TaxID=545502 RepID=UPI000EEF7542|nr:hypothetical protein [Ornithinibacillus sp.]
MISPNQNRVHTVIIHVNDLMESVKWYCRLLGQSYELSSVERPVMVCKTNGEKGEKYEYNI